MKIIISGSSGFIGSALVAYLKDKGHHVKRLMRSKLASGQDVGYWDPENHILDPAELQGYDAVINIAGENIFGRWTTAKKQRILSSRIDSTRLLTDTLVSMSQPPSVLINASAVGYYGERGEEELNESSQRGDGFLAEVCHQWELAAEMASTERTRVVCLRIGVVLSSQGGALKMMLTPFKLGLGGRIGSGTQFMSWIALDDLLGIFLFALEHKELKGPINAVSPQPVTNRQFTETLAKVLYRPACFPVPAFAARWAMGEMAEELLLASTKAVPFSLLEAGYDFQFPGLDKALIHLLR